MKLFFKCFSKPIAALKQIIDFFKQHLNNSFYRIEELDVNTGMVVLYHNKLRTLLKTTITDAIFDATIMDSIHPIQACWLGYYLGKALKDGTIKQSHSKINFLLRPSQGRYNIVVLDHREQKITYVDVKLRIEYTKPIVELAQNEEFLKSTSPSQACFIGIWTGMAVAKHGPDILNIKSKISHLKIVK